MARAAYLHSSTVVTGTFLPSLRLPVALLYSSNLRQTLPFACTKHFHLSLALYRKPSEIISTQAQQRFSSLTKEAFASVADLQYEGPLKIVQYPDPILRARNKSVRTFDGKLKQMVNEMFDVMYRTDGIGLSAPQVGVNIQLMVFNTAGIRGEGEEIVLVNPRISRYSKKRVIYNEGCLSFPRINADVARPDSIKVEAQDNTGARFELTLAGLSARVFQHEYDHLQGILFFDRMSDEVLDGIRADLQAMENSYEERTRSPSPEKVDTRRKKTKAVGFGKS